MSARRAALILWCALVVVLPLPVWLAGDWGGLPPLRSFQAAFDGAPWLGVQALAGSGVVGVMAWAYRRWAEPLPGRIRGALVGLFALTALIVLSAVPVYRWPASATSETFLEIYNDANIAGPVLSGQHFVRPALENNA